MIDPRSASNIKLRVTKHADLLVVSTGPAVVAAFTVAEGQGAPVALGDQNPIVLVTVSGAVPRNRRCLCRIEGRNAGCIAQRDGQGLQEVASEVGPSP